jgi:hypothetical protein
MSRIDHSQVRGPLAKVLHDASLWLAARSQPNTSQSTIDGLEVTESTFEEWTECCSQWDYTHMEQATH